MTILLALGALCFAVATARLFVWPATGAPDRVDAVVKLGGTGDRELAARALASAGRAPVLLDSTPGPLVPGPDCAPPMPGVRVICFHPDPPTTRGEARFVGAMAAREGWRSVLLVTSPDQAWRARLRVGRCMDGDVYSQTVHLRRRDWVWQIPYQWAATAKAMLVEREC